MKKRWISLICILALGCSLLLSGCGGQSYRDVKAEAESYLLSTLTEPGYGDEWKIIGLARDEAAVEDRLYEAYYENVEDVVKGKKGILNERKYTEYSRVILALTAIGKDATAVGGYDLVEPLQDIDAVAAQGINGPIWALIALDSGDYGTKNQRIELIDEILKQEITGGGFGLSGKDADCDLTAMAVQALAPYTEERADVAATVERGMDFLNTVEKNCSENYSQTIVALTAMGLDAEDAVTGLLSYACEDGGFCHELAGEGETAVGDSMATEQAYYALAAYDLAKQGKGSLYDMK